MRDPELFQALNDTGLTIPRGGGPYWVGEAMGSPISRIWIAPREGHPDGINWLPPATRRTSRVC